jgi:hypothetical protein
MWGLSHIYGGISSRKDPRAAAHVTFQQRKYGAWVTTAAHGRSSPAFRLWFDDTLGFELKHAFLMSYMRSLEGNLSGDGKVEDRIPFWEFLDIEFDRDRRLFKFVAYYSVRNVSMILRHL